MTLLAENTTVTYRKITGCCLMYIQIQCKCLVRRSKARSEQRLAILARPVNTVRLKLTHD